MAFTTFSFPFNDFLACRDMSYVMMTLVNSVLCELPFTQIRIIYQHFHQHHHHCCQSSLLSPVLLTIFTITSFTCSLKHVHMFLKRHSSLVLMAFTTGNDISHNLIQMPFWHTITDEQSCLPFDISVV